MNEYEWINPVGGVGDALMLSGVLKLAHDKDPSVKYNMIRRSAYTEVFRGHPAIAQIGYMPANGRMKHITYWSLDTLGAGAQRPFQILARAFGLKTPVEEHLYLHDELADDPVLNAFVPWKPKNLLFSPASASPRKQPAAPFWQSVIERLCEDPELLVIQIGKEGEAQIPGTYSLIGRTNIREAVALTRRCTAVLTCDSFLMHAAHLAGTPAAVIWGPTDHRMYGYPEQTHIQAPDDCPEYLQCIGPTKGAVVYGSVCPRGTEHCMEQIPVDSVVAAARKILGIGSRNAIGVGP